MKNIVKISLLFMSLYAFMMLSFSATNITEAEYVGLPSNAKVDTENSTEIQIKDPDLTNYVDMYEDVYLKILETQKSLSDTNAKLSAQTITDNDTASLERQIEEKKRVRDKLFDEAKRLENLNIESYKLDPYTQKIFDDALVILTEKYLSKNGVYDIFPENKYRKIIIFVDPDDFENSIYLGNKGAFVTELENAVNVDLDLIFEKMILTHSTSCVNATMPCHPAKGGISVSHKGSTGYGNTIGFKALHENFGYGFVIAKHEVPNGNEQIVQPKNSAGIIGVTKSVGGLACDCAFIQLTDGHRMHDSIFAPDFGSTYPVQTRNTSPTPAGTILVWDGLGSSGRVGTVIYELPDRGKVSGTSLSGDSGAAVFKPLSNGKADVYGIAVATTDGYTYYEPYNLIKSELDLQW